MNNGKLHIAILGASGYTGVELVRLLASHPHAYIHSLSANAHAGKQAADIFPQLYGMDLPRLQTIEEIDFSQIDVVFCCLPHAMTQEVVANLPQHLTIIDLSADFRLRDPDIYARWYGHSHQAMELQEQAVYGLSEHYREQVKNARLIANPGCYPTCSLLPLIPLLKAGIASPQPVIIDAKSGVSGAGRSVQQHLLFNEVSEGMAPYGVNQHRHIGELEQEIALAAGSPAGVIFVPHLIPMRRGMIATIYLSLNNDYSINDARGILTTTYQQEPFVHILPEGQVPSTHGVRGSNHCHLNLFKGSSTSSLIAISAIDNLMKGASGQAVQNMNIRFGFTETLGLPPLAMFP